MPRKAKAKPTAANKSDALAEFSRQMNTLEKTARQLNDREQRDNIKRLRKAILDNYKRVVEGQGAAAGDALLVSATKLVKENAPIDRPEASSAVPDTQAMRTAANAAPTTTTVASFNEKTPLPDDMTSADPAAAMEAAEGELAPKTKASERLAVAESAKAAREAFSKLPPDQQSTVKKVRAFFVGRTSTGKGPALPFAAALTKIDDAQVAPWLLRAAEYGATHPGEVSAAQTNALRALAEELAGGALTTPNAAAREERVVKLLAQLGRLDHPGLGNALAQNAFPEKGPGVTRRGTPAKRAVADAAAEAKAAAVAAGATGADVAAVGATPVGTDPTGRPEYSAKTVEGAPARVQPEAVTPPARPAAEEAAKVAEEKLRSRQTLPKPERLPPGPTGTGPMVENTPGSWEKFKGLVKKHPVLSVLALILGSKLLMGGNDASSNQLAMQLATQQAAQQPQDLPPQLKRLLLEKLAARQAQAGPVTSAAYNMRMAALQQAAAYAQGAVPGRVVHGPPDPSLLDVVSQRAAATQMPPWLMLPGGG